MGARFRRRQPDLNVKQPRHASAVSRRVRPSFAGNSSAPQILRSSNEEGAGKAGCPLHPWPACSKKSTRQQPQVHRNQPAFPARMVLTVSFALSSATSSFLPPSPCGLNSFIESPVGSIKPPQDLASATDARTTRLRRPRQHRSSCALPIAHELDSPCDSPLARPTPSRPPHPALHVRDDRDTPLLVRRDEQRKTPNEIEEKWIIFCGRTGRPKSA